MKIKKSEVIIFRPDISNYQIKNFRELEKEAFKDFKYCSDLADLRKVIKDTSKIIFISTSNTTPELYSDILDRVILWIHPNSGYDNISKDFIASASFPILNGSTIRADAVFLYIIQCLLASLGKIPFSHNWDPRRSFNRKNFYNHKSLIIGHGNIGKKVAAFLKLSNIEFDIYDPYNCELATIKKIQIEKYDSVLLCCGLNQSSKYIISSNLVKAKSDVTIINAARGELIEERELLSFLKANKNASAYLDVFEKEPNDLASFKSLDNIFLTSHIAGVYNDIDEKIIEFEQSIIFDIVNLDNTSFIQKYVDSNLNNKIRDGILI